MFLEKHTDIQNFAIKILEQAEATTEIKEIAKRLKTAYHATKQQKQHINECGDRTLQANCEGRGSLWDRDNNTSSEDMTSERGI